MKSSSLLLLLVIVVSSPVARSSPPPPSLLSLLDSPLALHLLQLLNKRQDEPPAALPPAPEPDAAAAPETFRATRDGPPLSIDLTFHLLRNMIHMAKLEGQREQALLNRKVLDEVGK